MPNSLYALIIGINNYPIPAHRLKGCVPDATEMHDFLTNVCVQEELDFKPLVLFNEQASFDQIVHGFEHFGQAQEGDICVLYYSGHGSQMPSPREFWKIDTDRLLETLVCYDSRLPGGRDLTDKELSYLIWKYTKKQQKDIHFLSIFDCCHSGTITRGVAEKPAGGLTSRMADKNPNVFSFSDMVGHQEYIRDPDGAIRPPLGNYVTLSAAQSDESAYEMNIGGVPRGVFTNGLLDVLQKSNLKYITYADVISRVYTRVQNRTNAQTPQHPLVNAYGLSTSKGLFLNGRMSKSPLSYVKHDQKQGWVVDMGSIHGLRKGAWVTVDSNGEAVALQAKDVRPGRSILEPEAWLDPANNEYLIRDIDLKPTPMVIGVDPALEEADKREIETAVKKSDKLTLDQVAAKYWAGLDPERGYILTRPGEKMPVFKGVRNSVSSPVPLFIDNTEKVAFWEYVSELNNPIPQVNVDSWVDIQLLEVVEHRDYQEIIKTEPRSIDEEVVLSYQYDQGQWQEPALQLQVNNRSNQDLWIAGLYLSEDFSITDMFMPVRQIRRGHEPYAFQDENGGDVIVLWLPDEIYSWGGTEIINKVKIIVSSEPFSVSDLLQDGLELEHFDPVNVGPSRAVRKGRKSPQWVVKDIQLRIVRPLDAKPLTAGRNLKMHDLTIEAHDSLSAKGVSLATSKEAARSVGAGGPQFTLSNFTDVINLATSRDVGKALDVVELNDVEGTDQVNAENPLKLKIGQALPEDTTIVPFGLDSETGLYFPLGYMDEHGTIRVEQIPDSEDGQKRGFTKSFKIYLKGVWFNKVLETGRDISVLSVAEVADENSDVLYITNQDAVRERVAEANKILVLIHGWMGDSRDKAKIIRRAKRTVGDQVQDLTDLYDLVLAFDYDSLGQTVATSAKQLKAQLATAGLGPDDGKTVHLLTHSTGGLVARWMLEQEEGTALADHLVMVGCPNLGTPWAKAYDMTVFGLSKLLNFLPIPGTLGEVFGFLGKIREGMDEAIGEMSGKSALIQQLNTLTAAPIPYTIIAGDTHQLSSQDDREEKLLRRYLDRFKGAYRSSLETVLFGEPNDDIVSLRSMQGIEGAQIRKVEPVGSSHMTYFASEAGVRAIGEVLFG